MDVSHRSNQQVTPVGAAAAPMPSAEEEAIKKNTDCVYFLASPLTCKKGSECEYRHSDNARLNPRDCWYWLNGNCLNSKCAFRHPPLDALLGPEVPNPVESFMPPVQTMAPATQMPYISNKLGVPCVFFQRGLCLKGDRCSFFHAPNSLGNKAPPKQVVLPTTEVSSKKMFGGLEKCTQEKNIPQINALKTGGIPKEGPALAKTAPSAVIADEPLKYKPASVHPNGNPVSRSSQMQHQHGFDDLDNMQNKDEEISREASPGFDVLVDDELRDSDYYPVEDQYGGAGEHDRSEYDINPSADYSIGDIDQDMAHGYDRLASHYGWEQRGPSSERKPGRAYPERRRYGNTDSLDKVGDSDLRHMLSKPRRDGRVNGLRSVISNDYTQDRHADGNGSYRERNNISSLSNRLRGRVKVPVRSPSPHDHRGRLSHQGRLQDRMKGRLQEGPSFVGRHSRGDVFGENDANFAAPKSLAELKGVKGIERNGGGKRKHQNLEGDLSFEGPKPLEEILKRKKRACDNQPCSIPNGEADTPAAQKQEVQPPPSNHSGGVLEKKSVDEVENGMIADQEAEYEEDDGEEVYEQQDGDYNLDELENGDPEEEEYLDDEDDADDFAKKMAVVFS